jgi:membrane carboxypeptidase/penicillin-binding protein
MAQMYSVFANGGFRVDPYFIARVDSDSGKIIYQATPPTACLECEDTASNRSAWPSGSGHRVVHYMMNSMLQDVVRMGTGRAHWHWAGTMSLEKPEPPTSPTTPGSMAIPLPW